MTRVNHPLGTFARKHQDFKNRFPVNSRRVTNVTG